MQAVLPLWQKAVLGIPSQELMEPVLAVVQAKVLESPKAARRRDLLVLLLVLEQPMPKVQMGHGPVWTTMEPALELGRNLQSPEDP